ncbi:protein of unknown function [Candidatus Nitrotoga arctica]|uniref:Uncharacterized protein n=1 Tax=Candidatus Nitrotoga arctica TaxID=453162 RepID=A0ABN8AJ21_9PROT|nr:protein of unknown function [Candidatus Nitrotoga arctica]
MIIINPQYPTGQILLDNQPSDELKVTGEFTYLPTKVGMPSWKL